MSTLIPNRQLEEIKAMTSEQLRLMRSCEVYDGDVDKDENYIYTHISRNPYDIVVADNKRIRAEQLAMSNNSIYPPESDPLSKEFVCNQCGASFDYRVALEGHKRHHLIKEKMKVLTEIT